MRLFLVLTVSLVFHLSPTIAQESPAPDTSQVTRIEAESDAEEIRFIIKGEAVGVLKADGLRINGDVTAESFLHGPKSVADTNDSQTGGAE